MNAAVMRCSPALMWNGAVFSERPVVVSAIRGSILMIALRSPSTDTSTLSPSLGPPNSTPQALLCSSTLNTYSPSAGNV
jgi:hypothetical protein